MDRLVEFENSLKKPFYSTKLFQKSIKLICTLIGELYPE